MATQGKTDKGIITTVRERYRVYSMISKMLQQCSYFRVHQCAIRLSLFIMCDSACYFVVDSESNKNKAQQNRLATYR